jgi:hypothetical protein
MVLGAQSVQSYCRMVKFEKRSTEIVLDKLKQKEYSGLVEEPPRWIPYYIPCIIKCLVGDYIS